MGKTERGANRQYTGEFKSEAVRLGASIGGNAAAKLPGVRQSTFINFQAKPGADCLMGNDVG